MYIQGTVCKMELNKKCITDINVRNKRIVIRADFDVPVENGYVVDNEPIIAAFSTIKYALDHECRSILLISHLGEPNGRRNETLSLKPIIAELDKLLATENHTKVLFLEDLKTNILNRLCLEPPRGSVLMLENIRFCMEESGGEGGTSVAKRAMVTKFRHTIERCGDVYINDAFRFAHLAHSSLLGQFFEVRVAGLLFQKELKYFSKTIKNPERPFVLIIGGNKFKTKLNVIDKMLKFIDHIIVGGGISFTFLKIVHEMKLQIGDSLYSQENCKSIRKLLRRANRCNVNVHLPQDFVVAHLHDDSIPINICTLDEGIPNGTMGLDIAPMTMYHFTRVIELGKTILWHGPMGVVENEACEDGTMGIMQTIMEVTQEKRAISIIIGDETTKFCKKWCPLNRFSLVSPGRAGIDILQGRKVPGIMGLINGQSLFKAISRHFL